MILVLHYPPLQARFARVSFRITSNTRTSITPSSTRLPTRHGSKSSGGERPLNVQLLTNGQVTADDACARWIAVILWNSLRGRGVLSLSVPLQTNQAGTLELLAQFEGPSGKIRRARPHRLVTVRKTLENWSIGLRRQAFTICGRCGSRKRSND